MQTEPQLGEGRAASRRRTSTATGSHAFRWQQAVATRHNPGAPPLDCTTPRFGRTRTCSQWSRRLARSEVLINTFPLPPAGGPASDLSRVSGSRPQYRTAMEVGHQVSTEMKALMNQHSKARSRLETAKNQLDSVELQIIPRTACTVAYVDTRKSTPRRSFKASARISLSESQPTTNCAAWISRESKTPIVKTSRSKRGRRPLRDRFKADGDALVDTLLSMRGRLIMWGGDGQGYATPYKHYWIVVSRHESCLGDTTPQVWETSAACGAVELLRERNRHTNWAF